LRSSTQPEPTSTALVCSDLQALINEANAQSGTGLSLTPVDEAA